MIHDRLPPDRSTRKEEIAAAFAPLEQAKLSAFVRKIDPEVFRCRGIGGEICMISVYGSDKPGIVYRVAKELAERKVNIYRSQHQAGRQRGAAGLCDDARSGLAGGDQRGGDQGVMQQLEGEMKVDITVRSITPVEL